MAAEENDKIKTTVYRYLEQVWNERNVEALGEFYPDPYLIEREGGDVLPSLEDAKEYISQVQAAFPDLSVTIEDVIAEGDKVAVRTTWRSSHQTEFKGISARASEQMEVAGDVIWRIADGKIVEMKGTLGEDVLVRLGWLEDLASPGVAFYKFPPHRCRRP
jgi:predicted ester cyclase